MLSYAWDGPMMTKETMTGPVTGVVEWRYDANFRVDRLTVNNQAILLNYDDDGLLTGAGAMTLSRGVFNGFLTGTALGPVTDAYTYSAYGETASYEAKASGASVFNVLYERDALGRITKKTETIGGATTIYEYSYDIAGRLTAALENGVTVSTYDYDANGNRITAVTKAGTFQGFYDLQDRMTKYGDATYNYTPNGELLTKTDLSGITTYDYDVFGNLRSVTMPDGKLIEYVIDAADRRIGRKVNGALTQGFIYAGQLEPVAELDGAGNVVSTFVYASKGHVPDYMVKGGVTYRIISDHLGSVRLIINTSDNSIAQRLDYDEFGNVTSDTNPGFQPFAFAGGIYDQDTKLTRFGARDYDPFTGRWTEKDPILFAGGDLNLYGYVLGDPVNYLDLHGLRLEMNGIVLSNEHVVENLNRLNSAIIALGRNDNEFVISVTGGDRYKDDHGRIRSRTNDEIIPKSRPNSRHLETNGARAVDVRIRNINIRELWSALKATDFKISSKEDNPLNSNRIFTYEKPDYHLHLEVGDICTDLYY